MRKFLYKSFRWIMQHCFWPEEVFKFAKEMYEQGMDFKKMEKYFSYEDMYRCNKGCLERSITCYNQGSLKLTDQEVHKLIDTLGRDNFERLKLYKKVGWI